MTKGTYWQRGESLDYKNNTSGIIESGTVVDLKTRIGVIGSSDIAPNEMGAINVSGVFEIVKTSDSDNMEMGDLIYFDGNGITMNNSDTPAGYVAQDSPTGAEKVVVKLLG